MEFTDKIKVKCKIPQIFEMGADIAVFVKLRPDTGHVVITSLSLLTAKPRNSKLVSTPELKGKARKQFKSGF